MATKNLFKKICLLSVMGVSMFGCANNNEDNNNNNNNNNTLETDKRNLSYSDYALMNLCGEDALNRRVERYDGVKQDKTRYVGLFYSLWLGQHTGQQSAIYDITKLEMTEEGRVALSQTTDNPLSKVDDFHFWGEPLYGYYSTVDKFVLARHIELLTNAGIDYLCVDNTNNVVYQQPTIRLLDLLLEFQHQGFKVPKVMFYTNSFSGDTVTKIYDQFYQRGKYDEIWFAPNGKPMIIGITHDSRGASDQTKFDPKFNSYISDEMMEYFDVKESEWPNGNYNENSIPWMSWQYPQYVHSGSISVPVAQHSHTKIYVSSKDNECSRGYDNETNTVDTNFRAGKSFQQMFDNAKNNPDVNNILVTSFNEWMAIKQKDATFVDVYNEEFSRDIEMMKGGYNDNFYMQLVKNVREFKYTPFKEYKKINYSIDIENGISPIWDVVSTGYQDFEGDAIKRDEVGAVNGLRYTDNSARNDIRLVKVANDSKNIYFYIECKEDITTYNGKDENYMNIWLKTNNSEDNFNGCNILINRSFNNNKGSVEESLGGYQFKVIDEADIRINGNVMQVKIPKANLKFDKENSFEFKVCDNVTNYKDVMDYYVTGDVVPLGRLRYGY